MEAQKKKETNLETNVFAEILVDVWSKRYCAATPSTRKQLKVVEIKIDVYKKR